MSIVVESTEAEVVPIVVKSRNELRKEVAAEWLAKMDTTIKKEELVASPEDYKKYHSLLQKLPADLPSDFQSLVENVLTTDTETSPSLLHQYRVVYLGVFIARFFKGLELPISLPGSWEDEERIITIMKQVIA